MRPSVYMVLSPCVTAYRYLCEFTDGLCVFICIAPYEATFAFTFVFYLIEALQSQLIRCPH